MATTQNHIHHIVGDDSDNKLVNKSAATMDIYFSADVETDGPIPGPYSILSFALVYAGSFDGVKFKKPKNYSQTFYAELKPISSDYEEEALRINGLDRKRLCIEGKDPASAMAEAGSWVNNIAKNGKPVLVAYPLSFDWSWLYWYFMRFSRSSSPFNHSRCFDIKTAFAVKAGLPIIESGRSKILDYLHPHRVHSHHALDDAIEQAEIFANVFPWEGKNGRAP